MSSKDYYTILEIPYNATEADIRKSFRILAFRFHPDKNDGDKTAEEKFKEIQEAYFILSDPERRETWHLHSKYPILNKKERIIPVTANTILERSRRLEKHIAEMDIFRMNRDILFQQIMSLLNDQHLDILKQNPDDLINQQIIRKILSASRPLSFEQVNQVNSRLALIAGANNKLIDTIYQNTKQKKQLSYWEKYNGFIILLLTILLCLLIWVIK